MAQNILQVENVKKYFKVGKKDLKAVDGVSFALEKHKSLGIVGESGSGKSTLARLILGLIPPTEGDVYLLGKSIFKASKNEVKQLRREIQMVFQNPYLSLFPHMTIGSNIEEPLRLHNIGTKKTRKSIVLNLMEQVGVPPQYYNSFPHELSGGQQQRVAIARALALEPQLIVFDEPVSSLDVSIQAQILNLLLELKRKTDLSYIFIAHDLAVVEYVSDLIAVMYLGVFVEFASTEELLNEPLHPYTQTLLKSVPVIGGEIRDITISGEIPSPINPPSGCPFHPRCPYKKEICEIEKPILKEVKPEHNVACHLY
ncbi:MAG: ATP-binding cassette domain-containing protein [Thermoanaerobacter sp.]|uniref:ABC-type dipeptide/oligopeptide/nickel transport system, ATPase component n=1 Tax=Caldanaerobacter subterraneus subsp. pacificus DSM 12653 TaxID=391606 RepID=B7R6C7_9THEO|nr:oligopeptide/dipeptide ABC transporter ATP-binding protein [Caldanaerobacter subterraneus]KKC28774.1 ABC-type dipeptide/oligopeptide/nickel transport system, ATPase component [Caldanaerobacter subterraneus subsp. pacificus DSM 12653]MBE3593361.1 ATP-binding cassette domain-containing protein [Thermoanaerobacter sp.]